MRGYVSVATPLLLDCKCKAATATATAAAAESAEEAKDLRRRCTPLFPFLPSFAVRWLLQSAPPSCTLGEKRKRGKVYVLRGWRRGRLSFRAAATASPDYC